MHLPLIFLAVAGLSLTPPPAHAWGRIGHQTIAALARSYLTSTARQRADELLAADRDTLTGGNMISRSTRADEWLKTHAETRSGRRRLRSFAIVAAAAWAICASAGRASPVALTFDDLPAMGLTTAYRYEQATTRSLLKRLRRHNFPATGFVIAENLDGDPIRTSLIDQWVKAGMDLGNHGYAHLPLNRTEAANYIADLELADRVLRPIFDRGHQSLHWFRPPYLETGNAQKRQAVEAWLSQHGYVLAPVTMENSDWLFALPYDEAVLHHRRRDAVRIRKAYLEYTAKVLPWYQQATRRLLGRDPAFIFLLHATRLNADAMDDLAGILRREGLQPTSLDRAMADPAYRTADTYDGPEGDTWLSRWSRQLHRPLNLKGFPRPPGYIARADRRLDKAP